MHLSADSHFLRLFILPSLSGTYTLFISSLKGEQYIGDPVVSQLYGKVETGEFGMVVTLGSFSSQAINFALNKSNLRLVDMILQHYEKFDSKYKGFLPFKRVYAPEKIEESERG